MTGDCFHVGIGCRDPMNDFLNRATAVCCSACDLILEVDHLLSNFDAKWKNDALRLFSRAVHCCVSEAMV